MNQDALIEAIRAMCKDMGVVFRDARGALPEHATRRFGDRRGAIQGMTVHHQAATPSPVGSQLDQPHMELTGSRWYRAVYRIAEYHSGPDCHIKAGGAPGMCYPMAVDPDGGLWWVHDLNVRTWSQGDRNTPGDENSAFLAVLFMGDFSSPGHDAGEPTAIQMRVLIALWEEVRNWLRAEGEDHPRITAHADFGKPACPGATLQAIVRALDYHEPKRQQIFALTNWSARQSALLELGFGPIKIDGRFGPRSKAALVRFQRKHGLTPDGRWGPQTERVMVEELEGV